MGVGVVKKGIFYIRALLDSFAGCRIVDFLYALLA